MRYAVEPVDSSRAFQLQANERDEQNAQLHHLNKFAA